MAILSYIKASIRNHGYSPKVDRINNRLIRKACVLLMGSVWCLAHIDYFITREKYFPRFELLLSRSCPFNCKCCIHFLPDYQDGKCESSERVIEDMTVLLSAIEHIDELLISGGDAFSYPELAEVVAFLGRSEKIEKITIVSTGAVSPNKDVIKLMFNDKIHIKVENYEGYSDKVSEFSSLPYSNIRIFSYDTWMDFGSASCRNRTVQELESQYSSCKQERYCLMNGRIYACPRSAHGENLGFFKNSEDEYVDLRKTGDKKDILNQIKQLRKVKHLTSCNHCNHGTEDFKEYYLYERFKDGSASGRRSL